MSLEAEERKRVAPKRRLNVVDHVWNFFASVKIAMVVIGLIAVSAIVGTLIPQENAIPNVDPAIYYRNTFGAFGSFMYGMGFTRMYTSWWFIFLLWLLAASLVICSWERLVPLYKSLHRQVVRRSPVWIRQRELYQLIDKDAGTSLDGIEAALRRSRYRVTRDGDALLAEKGRLSRYGPYILHIGLLLVIAAAFLRLLPGWFFNEDLIVDNGQSVAVGNTPYTIRNNQFVMQNYPDGRAKLYQTDATLFKGMTPVAQNLIKVNHPLVYDNLYFFQESFTQPRFQSATVRLSKRSGGVIGSFTVDLSHIQKSYTVGAYRVELLDYFPDFSFDGSEPVTTSSEPNKPVFVAEVYGPDIPLPTPQWFVMFMPIMSDMLSKNATMHFDVTNVSMAQSTVLRVHKDLTLPYMFFGVAIVLAGLAITFYIQHRRWWVRLDSNQLHIGAHTNKNWFGLRKEYARVLEALGVHLDATENREGLAHAGH